uniref:Ycf20 n=1 Tax=Blidingia minima TaxID=63414 RepID=A0A2Z4M9Q7_9CHLO|nr:Ycf20 [Blidingia minima]QUX32869.1 Ycf20 [Blidingia minima]
MKSNTRLLGFLDVCQTQLQLKFLLFETQLPTSLFVFFLGFMNGNLFGTILIFFRQWVIWDVIIIIMTILFIEFINYSYFQLTLQKTRVSSKLNKLKPNGFQIQENKRDTKFNKSIAYLGFNNFIRQLNFYKIGLLLGFFIDAFKVGS